MPNHALIILTGHLGRDAETKFLTNSTPVTRFTLAVTTGFGDKKLTSWYSCSAFGDRYQKIASYLTKGKPITVVGEPSNREYTTDAGVKRMDIQVRVNDIVLLGGRDEERHAPAEAAAAPAADHSEIPF